MSLGFRFSTPQEGSRMAVPIISTSLQGDLHSRSARQVLAFQGPLVQDLPKSLDQIEPSRALRYRDEMEAGMTPVPQHRFQRPMQSQGIDNQIDFAFRDKPFQLIEESDPRGSVTRRHLVDKDFTFPMSQRAINPDLAMARIVRCEMGAVCCRRPRGTGICLGRHWP